jgi:hypothetical protein
MTRDKARLFRVLTFSGPGLLAVAHIVAVVAVLSFGRRAGAYPLHPVGVALYGAVALLAALGLFLQSRQIGASHFQPLFWLSLPALVSFLFWIGLGGSFAPYDPHDSDLMWFSYLTFAFLFALIAVVYRSFTYLIAACVIQVVLYSCTSTLPVRVRYPAVSVLGEHPGILATFVAVYFMGALLLLRKRIAGGAMPGLWLAAVLSSGVGGAFLYRMLIWLPVNGAYLGWVSATTYVPDRAWNWIRTAAELAAAATVVVTVLSGIWLLRQQVKSRLFAQDMRIRRTEFGTDVR